MSKVSTHDAPEANIKPSLLSLPEELIEHICESFAHNLLKVTADVRMAWFNFCLISKKCDRIGRPFLYRYVQLSDYDIIRFTKSVVENNHLGLLVTSANLDVTLGHRIIFSQDIRYFQQYIQREGTHDVEELERVVQLDSQTYTMLFWIVVVETLLLKLPNLEEFRVDWDSGKNYEVFGDSKMKQMPKSLLPSLRRLTYNETDGMGNISSISKILEACQLRSLVAVGCEYFEISSLPRVRKYPSLEDVRLVNCRWLTQNQLQQLITACPNLRVFQWIVVEAMDDDEEEEDESFPLTPTDIVEALDPLRKTLKSLSMTTDSLGDDDGFPSLRHFTALEDLQVDVFDLADYDEDDESEEEEDEEDEMDDAISDDAENGGNAPHITFDNGDGTTTNIPLSAGNTGINADNTSDSDDASSSSENDCKPILHLLPQCLKRLWIDSIDDIDSGLDHQLLKLASTAHEDFPRFQQITIETRGDNPKLHDAFEKAGIRFIQKRFGYTWSHNEGLGEFVSSGTEDESEDGSENEDESEDGSWEDHDEDELDEEDEDEDEEDEQDEEDSYDEDPF